jgi:hypothetical protein
MIRYIAVPPVSPGVIKIQSLRDHGKKCWAIPSIVVKIEIVKTKIDSKGTKVYGLKYFP